MNTVRAQTAAPMEAGSAGSPEEEGARFSFDLPSQPLGEAIKHYGNQTRVPALVPGDLVAGRTSSPVHGTYSPHMALQLLLQGTGLRAEKIPGDALGGFVLKPEEYAIAPPPHPAELGDLSGYGGLVQARVWSALCANPRTRPGAYRVLLRFQIDAIGKVQRVRLLGSSGNAGRDAEVRATLDAVQIDAPPPAALQQPLTLLIEPHAQSGGPQCDAGGA